MYMHKHTNEIPALRLVERVFLGTAIENAQAR
jgi:hypothetical protein